MNRKKKNKANPPGHFDEMLPRTLPPMPRPVPAPKPKQNAETLHFFDAEHASIGRVLGEAYKTLAIHIDRMPDSFSKAVALRHLLESRDWAARAEHIRPVAQWVEGEENVTPEFAVAKL